MEILGCLGLLAIMVAGTIFEGFALTVLWGWFIVPTFNLPPLTIPVAIGVSLIAALLTYQTSTSKKGGDTSDAIVELAAWAIAKPIMYLTIGWIVTLFM